MEFHANAIITYLDVELSAINPNYYLQIPDANFSKTFNVKPQRRQVSCCFFAEDIGMSGEHTVPIAFIP